MERISLNEFAQEVKEWAETVREQLVSLELNSEFYEQWDKEITILITNIEEKMQGNRSELSFEEAVLLEERAKQLYERSLQFTQKKHNRVPVGGHTLPPLPYQYDALEPYISEEIMKLHHDEHHKSYVDGLNKAEVKMQEARKKNNFEILKHWEREASFHGSGHYLHTIFWNNMSPDGGGKPSGQLLNQIEMDFGSYDAFTKHFKEAAKKVEGVGWAILVWAPRAHRLEILQSEKHQYFTQWDTVPLLVLDVWEHAYYLQYKNNRGDYVKNWWNVVNWPDVEKRFKEAKKLQWEPY